LRLAAGWCFLTDTDTDTDTDSYNGVGKFEKVSGSGTFTHVASFGDGSSTGIVEGTYERQ
jgi:hypothetical protein